MFSPLGSIKDSVEKAKAITARIHAVAQEVRDQGFSKRNLSEITEAVKQEQESLSKVTGEMMRIFGEAFAQIYQEAIEHENEEELEVEDKYGLGFAEINTYVSQSSTGDPLFESRLDLAGFIEELRPLFDLIDILAQNTIERPRLVNEAKSPYRSDGESDASYIEIINKANFFTIYELSLSILANTINLPIILFFHQLGAEASKVKSLKPLCDFGKELVDYAHSKKVNLSNGQAVEN
jgi:hypothetical protein